MKKILILGSNGIAGHVLMEYFKDKNEYELFGLVEENFSSSNYDFEKQIKKYDPNIIINTLRLVVQECEEHPKRAIFINSFIPRRLEKLFYYSEMRIIHLSTDCVFSGIKGDYSEIDPPDGTNIYSISKFCGEIINKKDLTIRTSYIGPNLINKNEELFDWFLRQNGEIKGYKNAYWNGVTTLELAKQINVVIKNNICGLYHLGSKNKISKYDLLSLIKKQWCKKNITIKEFFKCKKDRSLIDTRQKLNVLQYDKMFNELYNFMEVNESLYGHYNYS